MKDYCAAFDIDDTLYLEADYVHSGFLSVAPWVRDHLGLGDFFPRAWALFQEGRRGDIFEAVLEQAGIAWSRETIHTMLGIYRNHTPDISLLPDAACCLDALQGRVHLAVVSDGPLASQQNKVRALGLERLFERIVLTSEWGAEFAKPNPRAFEELQRHFEIEPRHCLYVADNPIKDFEGPRQAGWKSIRIRRRQGLYSSIESSSCAPDEVSDLFSLPKMLEREITTA